MTDRYLFRGFHPCENGSKSVWIDGEKINGEWVYGYYLYKDENIHLIFDSFTDLEYSVIYETVGQYTGRDDKNRCMVFEGDIVRYACGFGDVQFSMSLGAYIINEAEDHKEWLFGDCPGLHVIGSIYSDPDNLI